MAERVIPSVKRKQLLELAARGKRIDGRGLLDMRPVQIETGVIEKAEGSAVVRLGSTMVMVGVKYEIGKPFEDTPNEGVLSVNAEFVPLASPTFEPGPPDENAIELARVVDRGLRESKCLDLEKMCLIPGEKVWIAWIDIYVLDHDGNLIDASALAAISALLASKIPEAKVENGEIVLTGNYVVPPIRDRPVAVTIGKLGDQLIVDPCFEEEEVLDCRLTASFTEGGLLCAMQKGLPGAFTADEVIKAIEIAKVKSEELRKLLPPLVTQHG
ncbi:MAG: exosome complex protein Rrp42 [Candidatus Verstraetearchaeota archaeon]|nr:exosome complex protein Rrp42 [Candidatus Verstraetearchaeota archaeon]